MVTIENFYQVRVKSIDFLDQPASAIYFYNITNSFKALQLSAELSKADKENGVLTMRERTLSNEIEAPLGSMLLAIEGLLKQMTEPYV